MDRFEPISITNSSLGAHLFSYEEILTLTTNVGLYSGPYKSLPHSGGTIYLTTHRLFYIDDAKPHSHSCYLPLELIKETQYYAGFLKSSPKITLLFSSEVEEERDHDANVKRSNSSRSNKNQDWRHGAGVHDDGPSTLKALPGKTWVCRICAFSNSLELSSSTSQDQTVKCQLCGVTSTVKDLQLKENRENRSADQDPASTDTHLQNLATQSQTSADGINCPICTFANHPSMSRCEMCNSLLGTFESPAITDTRIEARKSGESLPSGAQTPVERDGINSTRHNSIRLSFRKGGDKAFYSTLKSTLKDKSWQKQSEGSRGINRDHFSSVHRNIDGRTASSAFSTGDEISNGATRRVGIEGVFSAIDLSAREDSEDMKDAFRDLEALMLRAKKMVEFAETLNAKLTRQEAAAKKINGGEEQGVSEKNDEAANIIRSSLVRLGLPTPAVTADMAKDEMEYNLQLAKELAGLLYTGSSPLLGRGKVLQKPLTEEEKARQNLTLAPFQTSGRGIIPLDELWCMWNRARGVALVSPKVLLNVSQVLPSVTFPSITCKTFQSGLRVLHTTKYKSDDFAKRVLNYIEAKYKEEDDNVDQSRGKYPIGRFMSGASTLEIAKREDCPLHLVSELLSEAEYETGSIVRDDQVEVTWYENHIVAFDWDQWKAHQSLK